MYKLILIVILTVDSKIILKNNINRNQYLFRCKDSIYLIKPDTIFRRMVVGHESVEITNGWCFVDETTGNVLFTSKLKSFSVYFGCLVIYCWTIWILTIKIILNEHLFKKVILIVATRIVLHDIYYWSIRWYHHELRLQVLYEFESVNEMGVPGVLLLFASHCSNI